MNLQGQLGCMRRRRNALGAASTLAILVGFAANPSLASAQDHEAQAVDGTIVVTGSRIVRDGFEAPTPVTVIAVEQMQDLGLRNAADVLAQLPQNSNFVSAANVGLGNFNIGSQLANLRGLNPFFGTRTLTLVNSKRHVATTNGGAVDLGVVPSILIARVETVTGGASAAYGSDAISGVTNIILNNELEGLIGDISFGQNFAGDGASYNGSLAYGTSFSGGRGHVVLAGEYSRDESIGACAEVRDWCAQGYQVFTNNGHAAGGGNGLPNFVFGTDARAFTSSNGLFPNLGVKFNNDGTATQAFDAGDYAGLFNFAGMQGGDETAPGLYDDLTLRPEIERYSVFGRAEYELTDAVAVHLEGSYHRRKTRNVQPALGASHFANLIYNDNFFLPAGDPVIAALPAYPFFGPAFFSTGAFSNDGSVLPDTVNNTGVTVYRGAFGLEGELSDTWDWNAYYTYGRTKSQERVANFKVASFFAWALDAVDDPGNPGSPICREVLLGNPLAAGCVPLNLFGVGNANPAALDYVARTLHQDTLNQQHVVALAVHGDVYDGWGAGPIGMALGAEFRQDSIDVTHDQENQPFYFSYERTFGADYAATNQVSEGYLELSVPVVRNAPLFQAVTVDGAIRFTHLKSDNDLTNSSEGQDFVTWKLSGVWDLSDWLRFRATRSRDVRAPSFYETFASATAPAGSGQTQITNPFAGGVPQGPGGELGGSAGNLGVEKADTWTIGTVVTGQGVLDGFRASLDWYSVDLEGPISSPGSAQSIVNNCFDNDVYCDFITGTGAVGNGFSNITFIRVPNLNLGNYVTRGFDGEVSYRLQLAGDNNLTFRAIGSYMYDMLIDDGIGDQVDDFAGVSGPTQAFGYFNTSPKFQGNAFATLATGPFRGTVQARFIGKGKYRLLDNGFGGSGSPIVAPGDPGYDPTLPGSISNNSVPSAVYINLSASYRIPMGGGDERGVEIFGSINNLFDKDPAIAPGGNGYPTNPVFFDTYGASFRIGARFNF